MLEETSKIMGERIKKHLSEGKRFDGRKSDQFREVEIETNVSKLAEGSARVRMGKTEVIVGVKMDTTEPYSDSPDKGNLMVNAELTPMSSPRFENGPPKFPAIELGRVIDRGIRESKFIKLNELCIRKGEKVWNVFIDVYSVNDDGNLLDAAGIGTIVALKNARIPKYDEQEGKVVYGELTENKIPLKEELPVSITVHKIGNTLIVDPTREEEDLSEVRVTNAGHGDVIYSMQKGDRETITLKEMEEILNLSVKAREEIISKIEKSN